MKIEKLNILPEKLFGMETGLLVVFVPLVVVVVLVVISINLLLVPKLSEYQQMSGQLNNIEQQTQQFIQKRNYLLSIDQVELKKNADFIYNALLPQKNSYLLVGMISQIASSYGYQTDSFLVSPGDVTAKNSSTVNGVASIPVTISIVGPADKYLNLIKGLESCLPVLSLDSFKMTSDGSVAKIDLAVSAYYAQTNMNIDITKLTLTDLTPTKEESDLLARLNQFTVLGNTNDFGPGFDTTKSYVKYNRADPFNP